MNNLSSANNNGQMILQWASPADGAFRRQTSQFRNWIGTEPNAPHPPEAGRYILYVSYACPWAHRTLIVRALKGLQGVIDISVVDYLMGPNGWKFSSPQETAGCIPDPVYNCQYLRELYLRADPNYSARFTVPVLWDKKLETIVNNESAEIVRMLNDLPRQLGMVKEDGGGAGGIDLYPADLRLQIDETNAWIYDQINNGVYKAGFATAQDQYELNARLVHQGLLRCEEILSKQPFIIGDRLTETDIRLFTTVLRHDPVYFGHFKCNLLAMKDLPNLLNWMRRICAIPGVKETINMEHIKKHYYMSHKQINPTGIVPLYDGPELY